MSTPSSIKNVLSNIKAFSLPIKEIVADYFNRGKLNFIFLLLPIAYLVNTIITHYSYGAFYLNVLDPEYAYIYNGIVIGGGNLSVDYYDHPGTPLQYLIAIAARITHLFNINKTLVQDFIDDPEKYIHAANILVNTITSLVIFKGGKKITKYTGAIWGGILFQLIPFANNSLFTVTGRLIPEVMMAIPILITLIIIARYIFSEESDQNNTKRIFILFAITIGFGIAIKIYYAPMLLLPLILIKSRLNVKLQYIGYLILFVGIFAYPIIQHLNVYWTWVHSLITHSGIHGKGANTIVDVSNAASNLKQLFNHDQLFFYILASATLIVSIVRLINLKRKDTITNRAFRTVIALSLSLIIVTAIIIKHFALHYFIPFYYFKFPLLFLSLISILRLPIVKRQKSIQYSLIVLFTAFTLAISYKESIKAGKSLAIMKERNIEREKVASDIVSLVNPDTPIILTGPYFGTPFIQYAHGFGFLWTKGLKGYFKPTLLEKYPNAYHYFEWTDHLYLWDDFIDTKDFLTVSNGDFYVYIGKNCQNKLAGIEERIWSILSPDTTQKEILYNDAETGEMLIHYNYEKTVKP